MSGSLTAVQHARFRFYLRILCASAVIGALYGASVAQQGLSTGISMLVGAINGVGIAGCIGGIEIFVLREGSSMKRLLGLPFILVVLLKTALYTAIVASFVVLAPKLALLFPGLSEYRQLERRTELVTIGFSLSMTLVIVILLQASSLLGRRTFRNLILGRYRRPRAERRFFLFVDVVGSTAIAERLGPLQAHRFLAAVFSAVAEPVASSQGEIYQYVGDEVVVTWTEEEGTAEARPLWCFFRMEDALRAEKARFLADFGVEPGLRAALHLGEVIAGEVGELRRAIVFHGDVMNTASRLEQATRDHGVRFIASADALQALGPQPEFDCRDLGALALRGRREPIRACSVDING